MDESFTVNIKNDDLGSDKAHTTSDHFDHKVTKVERFFLIANLILELPSAAFDQLSSVHKPQYALLSMIMSLIIMLVSIIDLVYKGRKGGVTWMNRNIIPWFYHPYPNLKPFGTFPDIIGLLCAVFQCFFASLAYTLLYQQIDNPIKISAWPIVFAFGLLYCRLLGNPPPLKAKGSAPKVRRLARVVEFSLPELVTATDHFSLQNMVGVGRIGLVYRGKLVDGSEVVVKRVGREAEKRISEEELAAFESELEFLSRLHHKHLIRLIGYYEDETERLLVYNYMKNGSVHHHLHEKKSTERNSIVLRSWKTRIKIALDAARGIEYLHKYAVPPVIHRAIKSSTILLDSNWTARVAEFTFSLEVHEQSEHSHSTIEAVGTKGYIDPEYYNTKKLTSKSDVYTFGVVLLELLTGKDAIFKGDDDNGGTSTSVVDFAVPRIMAGEFVTVLDPRVSPPELNETQALELVAYTALHCVSAEGRNRPSMTAIVANLEQSLSIMDATASED